MLRSLSAACAFTLFAAATTIAHAQGFGTTGSSAFGSSGFGNSGFGSMGQSGFGSSMGMGNTGFGSMSGFGSMGSGMSGFGNSGLSGMSSGNSIFGNQGLGGNTGGQNFVGRDSGDMASTFTQMGQAGTQFFNQMNRNMSRNNQQPTTDQVENPKQEMRITLQVAFTAVRPTPNQLTNTLRTRLSRILAEQDIVAPQVTMEGDVAVLGGVAATESQRLVLEKIIAMEPGISQVRNEMTVIPPTATE